jgi:hypothetical protein
MSHRPSSSDGGVKLEISLPGDIQVTITAPSSAASLAADLLGFTFLCTLAVWIRHSLTGLLNL